MIIDASVKEIQNELLLMLKDFDRICQKNNIQYNLHGGTLLGAIRHKGFIPWDDDVDITISRSEYHKLMKCFDEESQDFRIVESYLHMPKVVRKKDMDDIPFAWMDLIIHDGLSDSRIGQKIKFGITILFQAMCRDKETIKLLEGKGRGKIKSFLFRAAYLIGKPFSYETKYRWYNHFAENRLTGSGKLIYRSNDNYVGMKRVVDNSWFQEYIYVPFEDTQLAVPRRYHELCIHCFGENYMTPIQEESKEDVHRNYKVAFMKHLGWK